MFDVPIRYGNSNPKPGDITMGTFVKHHKGAIANGALITVLVLFAAWVTAVTVPARAISYTPATGTEVATSLMRAGITPDVLAAAGVSSSAVATVFSDAASALNAEGTVSDLRVADTNFASSQRDIQLLTKRLRSGQATAEDQTALQAARSANDSAATQRSSIIDAVFDAAKESLSLEQVGRIETIAAGQSWGLPVQYSVVSRTEAQWLELRDALANVRICTERDVDPDATCNAVVAAADAVPAVVTARNAHERTRAAHENAWTSAMNDIDG